MRFLCLHGHGTNGRILEMQISAIRFALGPNHQYDFIDGSLMAPMTPGIEPFVSEEDEFFRYADENSSQSKMESINDLLSFIEEEGPFEGVIGFSSGAILAACVLIHQVQKNAQRTVEKPLFQCAVFFCTGYPEDPADIESDNDSGTLRVEKYGELIQIPTAHIWGVRDSLHPSASLALFRLCRSSVRQSCLHSGGHEIPGSKDPEALESAVRTIKRAIIYAGFAA
ncbi:MAG: hypothetical protein Q9165_006152 [Trypethelium subeluteriae]